MTRTTKCIALAGAIATLACGGGGANQDDGTPGDACAGVTCSGHGTCYVDGTLPACDCDDGYHDSVLTCVADGSGFAGSCTLLAGFTCVDYTGSSYTSALVQQACEMVTGSVYSASPCPSAGRLGRCTRDAGLETETVASSYSPLTEDSARQACQSLSGSWTSESAP